ncbi:hypothetical protein [Planomonospora venezuelensis]|uniref:Uncharacterized protein n=1 Tax=Planomonospora venezuelensis TaxID=1999 RepID=A0A841CY06_PLAVE|nr:hypothetical protein [Planomonospora venezuelensis]MBB5962841.1 hypothetical protein [Planomonospora venezuelensis]GIM99363.1 hypothetical protein Pve01_10220 [Planomonospora venezuelensis]
MLVSLGLAGTVTFAAASLTGSHPADAATRLVAADPSEIPGCDVDPAAECSEEPTPIVTVTITHNPGDPEPRPTTTSTGQVTVTATVTVPPTTPPATTPPATTAPPATTPPVQVPTSAPVVEPPPVTPSTTDPEVVFPSTEQTPTALPTASAEPTGGASAEPDPATAPYVIRNANSDYNTTALSRQLGILALILVLLVVFAILIFEGRLRRLAHAAAVRRAGPRPADPSGYPAGPGFTSPGFPHAAYQGGAAYAPIISFVPMQMYPPVYPEAYPTDQYPQPEPYPQPYDQPTVYAPPPTGPFDRPPYPPEGTAAFHGGHPVPYGGPQGHPGDLPGAPPPPAFGDFPADPFPRDPALQGPPPQGPADRFPEDPGLARPAPGPAVSSPMFHDQPPFGPRAQSGPAPQEGAAPFGGPPPFGGPMPQDGPAPFGGPMPQDGPPPFGGPPPAGPSTSLTGTAVYPIPGEGAMHPQADPPGKKRGLFRRKQD